MKPPSLFTSLLLLVLMTGGFMPGQAAEVRDRLPRFEQRGVVLSYEGLKYRPQDDVIFPSVVATAGRFKNPLGRYYLYYAPHNAPGGICLAYADKLEGPWTEYAANPVISREWKPHYKVSHVSGPHALWSDEERQLLLYFHGENPDTRLATSADGIHFTYDSVVVSTRLFPRLSEASYARVFRQKLPGRNNTYVMLLMGNNAGTRRIYLAWSKDGRTWTPQAQPFMDPPPGTDQVAGAWLLPWRGRQYVLAHANLSAGGKGGINNTGFHLYLSEVDPTFTRTTPLGKFMDASEFAQDNAGLMSPCVFEENGTLYLFFNVGPRLNNKIALAVAKPK
jgi:hypothetical protein